MEQASAFERERGRLVIIAARILDDRHEAEDVVQRAWLRLQATTATIDNLPAWLTTVFPRLCIDRLRERIPVAREPDSLGAGVDSSSSSTPDDPLASIERRKPSGRRCMWSSIGSARTSGSRWCCTSRSASISRR